MFSENVQRESSLDGKLSWEQWLKGNRRLIPRFSSAGVQCACAVYHALRPLSASQGIMAYTWSKEGAAWGLTRWGFGCWSRFVEGGLGGSLTRTSCAHSRHTAVPWHSLWEALFWRIQRWIKHHFLWQGTNHLVETVGAPKKKGPIGIWRVL